MGGTAGRDGLRRSNWLQAAASSSDTSPCTLTPCCDSEPIINKEDESDKDARKECILLKIPDGKKHNESMMSLFRV